LAEARENFLKYRTIRRPGGPGPNLNDARVVELKERMLKLFDQYMGEPDEAQRTALYQEARRLEDLI
jgi:hypothetical protein